MIIGVIIDLAVGAACVVLGLLLWKKRMISILHEYHYKNVKKSDIPAYTRQIGIGLSILGVGIIITGLLNLAHSSLWWLSLSGGFIIGLIVMYKAQKKYNGSELKND